MNTHTRFILTCKLAGLALLASSGVGCKATHTDFQAFLKQPRPIVTSEAYILAPPDEIRISSKRVREIDGQGMRIRPDGRVNLPLLGSVLVAGKTPEQVSEELSQQAQEFYEDAEVTVWVTRFASKRVYVFGEVAGPGPYPYNGTNTVLETLARAQPTRLADPGRIELHRPSPDGELRKAITIDLDRMIKAGDTTFDAVLEEGDLIYVPANPLAKVGLVIQQILLPLQPMAQTVRGSADVYNDTRPSRYED